MDFSSAKLAAEFFVKEAGNGLKIIKLDVDQSQIHFMSTDDSHTFCVSCPSDDSETWTVWSDAPTSQTALQDVMDKVDVEHCTHIQPILEALTNVLKNQSGVKGHSDGSKDKKEEDDDSMEETEDSDEDEYYYAGEDFDAEDNVEVKVAESNEEESNLASNFFNSTGSPTAVSRLVKDLKILTTESPKFGIIASPRDNNLFAWEVKLINIPSDTRLGKDLKEYQCKHNQEAAIQLSVTFPTDYPFSPPFIRVIRPRFRFLTGHVTVGGSICMEMLTKSGWCPTNDLESILVQVRTEILSDPNASLDPHRPHEAYREDEARDAFRRMVKKYGWS